MLYVLVKEANVSQQQSTAKGNKQRNREAEKNDKARTKKGKEGRSKQTNDFHLLDDCCG